MNNEIKEQYKVALDYMRRTIQNDEITESLDLHNIIFLYELSETCGEGQQLNVVIGALRVLMGWCEVAFNDEQEIEDYEKLNQAFNILMEVYKSYKENY